MKKYFISILILFALLLSDVIAPENGVSLNTTHVLFEWEQVPDAVSYRITWIYGNNPEMLLGEEYTESLIYINTEIFDWDTPYVWHVQPVFSDGNTGSYITNSEGTSHLNYFNIGSARSDAYSINNNPSQYSDGITLFSSFFDYYSAAIDQNGNEMVQVNRADGLGVSEIKKLGIDQLIISTEKNSVVSKRAKKLGIPSYFGIDDKKSLLLEYCNKNSIDIEKIIYIGINNL